MGGASSIVAKSTWLIGVFLAIGADVLSNLGTNLQKLAHTQLEAQQDRMLQQQQDSSSDNPDYMLDIPTPHNEAAIDIEPIQDDSKPPFDDEEPAGVPKPEPDSKPSYTQSPTWILGIALLILSAVADFLALLFASQSIVSPLGSLTLVVNLFLARWMHGEVITVTGVAATLLIVAGSFLTVAFADHSVLNLDLEGILNLYFTPRFVVYALLVGSSITMIWYYAVKWSKEKVNAEDHPEIYPLFKLSIACLNGTLGGHNVLFAKLTVELLSVGKLQCLTHPMFYFTLAMLVMTIVTQVSWLNEGLRRFDAIFMIPVSTAFWVFFSVFSGIVTTGEYARMTWDEISFFTLGMMFILVGVLIFSRHKPPSTAQQAARMEKAKKSMKFLPPMSLKTLSSKNDVQSPLESPTGTREDQTLYLPKKYS